MKLRQIPPNLVTLLSLITALLALYAAHREALVLGSWLIALSIICDGLDGKLARALGSSTHFGAEFDSLADFVAFGVVPGFLIWQAGLQSFGVWGAVVCILYIVAGGLRLARFNIRNDDLGSKHPFEGLPIPSAAGIVTSFIILQHREELFPHPSGWLLGLAVACMFLMVSSIEYPPLDRGFKNGWRSLTLALLVLVALIAAFWFPQYVFFVIMICYVVWGLLRHVLRLMRLYPQNRLKGTTS